MPKSYTLMSSKVLKFTILRSDRSPLWMRECSKYNHYVSHNWPGVPKKFNVTPILRFWFRSLRSYLKVIIQTSLLKAELAQIQFYQLQLVINVSELNWVIDWYYFISTFDCLMNGRMNSIQLYCILTLIWTLSLFFQQSKVLNFFKCRNVEQSIDHTV